LEENPWDVFETIFNVDSEHEGTIIEINDKSVVVALPYGVEGISTVNNIVKEDGTSAKLDEKLNFKVIEFSKDAKKIFVSHTRTFEDDKKAEEAKDKQAKAKNTKKIIKKVKDNVEKTTLGDIAGLAELKSEMEKGEENAE
jgi:small subunit ribosomal protein S1